MFKIRHSCAAQDRIKTLTSLEPLGCSRKHLPEMSGSPYLKKCPQNFLENILIVFPVPNYQGGENTDLFPSEKEL